jgi:outer membrane protein OmpA-like peptidoglycan-associated protein
VTSAEKRGGTYVITGLRDPLAVDPMLLLQATKLNPEKVNSRWEPYYALYPEFILTRAKALLEPPATVTLTVKNGILSASGVASQHWNREARRLVRVLPGITQFDDTNLVDPDHQLLASIVARLQPPDTVTLKIENGILYAIGTAPHRWIVEVRQLLPTLRDITQFQEDHLIDSDLQVLELRKEQLEKSHLYFERGGVQLTAEQNEKLQRLRTDLEKLFEAAQAVGQSVHIEIVGHSDTTGSEERINKRLSQERADAVLAALTSQGIDTTKFTTLGMGSKALLREEITEQDRALNRRVSFRVMLTDAQPSP